MKVLSVVGTRPNMPKEFMIRREFDRRGVEEVVVHTGQHYDHQMSQVFFDGLEMAQPKYHFNQEGKSNIQQTASIMLAMEETLKAERPTCTLVYGDVNSTVAAALASAKLRIPVVHYGGGTRSDEMYNPEEINRRVTDQVSALIFTSTAFARQNLVREGFAEDRICFPGDLLQDAILYVTASKGIEVRRGDYILVTLHREENAESPERLGAIVKGLIDSGQRVVFPVHPRTRQRLERYGLLKSIEQCPRIELREPQGYVEFIRLLAGANRVLTDSGGVRKEAYMLSKPVVVPIGIVWFPELVETSWMVTVEPPDAQKIAHHLATFEPAVKLHPDIFGKGRASETVVGRMLEYFG